LVQSLAFVRQRGKTAAPVPSALFRNLPIDPELTRPFPPFFGLKIHFLFETARDLDFQGVQMAIFACL